MKIEEKLIWLYDKLETIAGILYDMSNLDIDKGVAKAIEDLWNEFNSNQKIKIKLGD